VGGKTKTKDTAYSIATEELRNIKHLEEDHCRKDAVRKKFEGVMQTEPNKGPYQGRIK